MLGLPDTRPRRSAVALGALVLLSSTALAGLAGGSATADVAGARAEPTAPSAGSGKTTGPGEVPGNYDSRSARGDALVQQSAAVLKARGKEISGLGQKIGSDAEVSVDALSGTPSNVFARTGFLTAASDRPAAEVALGFVRANLGALGLAEADLGTLNQNREVTDLNGITHVYWTQEVDGVPVFGNGLRAHVDKTGRLIALQGAPVAGLAGKVAKAPDARLSSDAATEAAISDARAASPDVRPGSTASRVWFLSTGGLRPGWLTYTQPSGTEAYQHVVDAATGRTLYRHSTVNFEKGDGLVHENYPGARGPQSGGKQHVVNLFDRGYLPRNANWMKGRWASAWADLNDDDQVQDNEKTAVPNGRKQFALRKFETGPGETRCTAAYNCTWDPTTPYSWRTNKNQDGVQSLYFTSKYAEWLSTRPFGFTPAMGNFERSGGDQVNVHTMDGGNTADGLPDGAHTNNANFNTPPDGQPPTMQMYLNQAPYLAASSSNAFDNIGHEFTHGLSNRLVVDSQGNSTLNSYQAGAMGEAWGDFYSFDYLHTKGLAKDTGAAGELMYDRYLSKDRAFTRSAAIDCPVDRDARLCKQIEEGGVGGYTYGDIPRQLTTEVHGAGEVWAQAMWDLHRTLGHYVTMRLVTSAMTISPDDPSMLDMRDAMITADQVIYSRSHTAALWKGFAKRGFGYYAASIDGADPEPVEDFQVPPSDDLERGSITGTVTNFSDEPVAGAVVLVAGHTSGAVGNWSTVTDADGEYEIEDVVPGTYPKVVAFADGYEPDAEEVTVEPGEEAVLDLSIRRDWAAESGGGSIVAFDDPDYTDFGCGPGGAIDLSRGTGWGSETTATGDPAESEADVDPKSITIGLPDPITVTSFGVDPTATCGDPGSASTAGYTIEVASAEAGPWTEVASGEFTPANQGTMVDITATAPVPDVSFVRYTMESPQVPDWDGCPNDYGGCTYMDTTEVAVYDDPLP